MSFNFDAVPAHQSAIFAVVPRKITMLSAGISPQIARLVRPMWIQESGPAKKREDAEAIRLRAPVSMPPV